MAIHFLFMTLEGGGVRELQADGPGLAGNRYPLFLPGTAVEHARNRLSPVHQSRHANRHCLEDSQGWLQSSSPRHALGYSRGRFTVNQPSLFLKTSFRESHVTIQT